MTDQKITHACACRGVPLGVSDEREQIEMVRRVARMGNETGFIAETLRDSEVFKLKQRIAKLEAERPWRTPMPTDKQYARRNPRELGYYYIRHVSAMTAEGLHAKSDIAAELGWRDREIARLREALERIANGPYVETREIARAALEGGNK